MVLVSCGDTERTRVIGFRVGARMELHYNWYKDNKKIGDPIKISLNQGDMYVMSEKAVGSDWKKKFHIHVKTCHRLQKIY